MKYTAAQIKNISWSEWNTIMAEELNKAGFLGPGYNPEKHRLDNHCQPYKADGPNSEFILGKVTGLNEINYLKDIGLLNNGRCPLCGGIIGEKFGTFTDGFNQNKNFQICNSCYKIGRRTSINPANNNGCGCITALLFMPYTLIKAVITNIN